MSTYTVTSTNPVYLSSFSGSEVTVTNNGASTVTVTWRDAYNSQSMVLNPSEGVVADPVDGQVKVTTSGTATIFTDAYDSHNWDKRTVLGTSNAVIGSVKVDGTAALGASEAHIGEVGGRVAIPSVSFTRPNNQTPYAVGQLVANSTASGSVTSFQFEVARVSGGSGMLRRARIRKTGTSTANAAFRLHLYRTAPTTGVGDGGTFLTNNVANYMGAFDVNVDRSFSDGAAGNGAPLSGSEINFVAQGGTVIYGLLEARGAYTPALGEVFTITLEVLQN